MEFFCFAITLLEVKKIRVLSGIRPWAPDLAGTPWGPMSLFEFDGNTATARPALNAIVEGAQSAKR